MSQSADETFTPQIDAILDSLTDLCCEACRGDEPVSPVRIEPLVGSLATNGWQRYADSNPPLSVILKERVKRQCKEPSMHRGAALDGIVGKVQQAYDDAARYTASVPEDQDAPGRDTSSPRTALGDHSTKPIN